MEVSPYAGVLKAQQQKSTQRCSVRPHLSLSLSPVFDGVLPSALLRGLAESAAYQRKNTRNWDVTGSRKDLCNLCASLVLHNTKPAARSNEGREKEEERERGGRGERRRGGERTGGVTLRQD